MKITGRKRCATFQFRRGPPLTKTLGCQMKRRQFWKGYFFLMLAMAIGGFVLPFFVPPEDRGEVFEDLALLPLYIAQLVGLFGFAYSRAIATRRVWQLIFGATVLEVMWVLYGFVTVVPPSELGSSFVVGVALIMVPFLTLLCVGLYSYAFRSTDLWAKAT
jgi:uncharacterized membrane protein YhaH (DUF805 family)